MKTFTDTATKKHIRNKRRKELASTNYTVTVSKYHTLFFLHFPITANFISVKGFFLEFSVGDLGKDGAVSLGKSLILGLNLNFFLCQIYSSCKARTLLLPSSKSTFSEPLKNMTIASNLCVGRQARCAPEVPVARGSGGMLPLKNF